MAVPAARLDSALAELLSRAGARTVRVVDGRTGTVVGAAGEEARGSDDPAAVAGLLRDAVVGGPGGLDDVLVTTDRSVHVLRPAPVPGVFVHLRLDLDRADVGRARRALADPAVQDAVRRAVGPVPGPRPRTRPAAGPRPAPATTPTVPAPRPSSRDVMPQQPALTVLAGVRTRSGAGARAVVALAELGSPGTRSAVLPRRRSAGGVQTVPAPPRPAARRGGTTAGLPELAWAGDLETLRRLAEGLRRLN